MQQQAVSPRPRHQTPGRTQLPPMPPESAWAQKFGVHPGGLLVHTRANVTLLNVNFRYLSGRDAQFGGAVALLEGSVWKRPRRGRALQPFGREQSST